MSDDLVQRLCDIASRIHDADDEGDLYLAADRIEALEAEVARLIDFNQNLVDYVERLRDALAHFATDENPDGWIAIAALTGKENVE